MYVNRFTIRIRAFTHIWFILIWILNRFSLGALDCAKSRLLLEAPFQCHNPYPSHQMCSCGCKSNCQVVSRRKWAPIGACERVIQSVVYFNCTRFSPALCGVLLFLGSPQPCCTVCDRQQRRSSHNWVEPTHKTGRSAEMVYMYMQQLTKGQEGPPHIKWGRTQQLTMNLPPPPI